MANQWPHHANPIGNERPWHKKKRFVIPLGLTALLVTGGLLAEDPPQSDSAVIDEPAATTGPLPSVTATATPVSTAAAARLAAASEAKATAKAKAAAEAKKKAQATARAKAKAEAKRKAKVRAAAQKRRLRAAAERREQERREAEEARSDCNPNYSGCVPDASDVDCAGGSGNGPEYLSGTARVIGSDVYDLDRDGDGIACDD